MTEISCNGFWETGGESLPGYPEDPALRKHLRECSHCREEYERLQIMMAELGTGFEGPRESEFWMDLRSSVKKELSPGAGGFSWLIDWWVGAIGTVAVALLVFLIPLKTGPDRYIQPAEYLSALPGYTATLAEYGDYEDTDTVTETEYMTGMTGWSSVLMDLYEERT